MARVVSMTTPFTFERGEGCELITDDGARYLDFIAGYAVVSTGHCHPRVVAAAQDQMARLVHVSTVGATEANRRYAERLCAAVPIPDAKVYFTNSGTESTEGALKLARHATGRTGLLAFEGGFHGRTLGSLSITSSKSAYRAGHGPFVPGVAFAPYARDDLDATLAGIARIFAHQLPALIGIELAEPELAGPLLGALLDRGVIACQCDPGGGVVRLSPPLVVGDAEIARFLEALAGAAASL